MDQPTTVTKIKTADKNLFIQIIWKNLDVKDNDTDVFHIKIFDQQLSWSGRYSREFAKQFRANTDENAEEYLSNVKKGLSGQGDSFTYEFSKLSEDSAKFSWKKQFDGSAVRLLHGSVLVHLDINVTKDSLIDFLLDESKQLRNTIVQLTNVNKNLSSDLESCKTDINHLVDMKTSLEHSLYGKFVKLLNTKKRKIRLLEENLNIGDGEVD